MAVAVRIRLVRSPIGTKRRVRETLKGLGLGRVGSESEITLTPAAFGMLRRVAHLVAEVDKKS